MLEPCDAKVSRTVLRGLGDRKVAWLLGRNAKQITCGTRFGVLVLFAFSGMNNAAAAPCATRESPGSQVGAFTIASPVSWGVRPMPRTAFCFIRSAMTGFIVSVWPYRNRVSLWEAFEGLEPDEGKLSRPVLRGPGSRDAAWLLSPRQWWCGDLHPTRFTALSAAPMLTRFCDGYVGSRCLARRMNPRMARSDD